MGLGIGVAIGVAFEEDAKKKCQIIKLTKIEKRKRSFWVPFAFILGLIIAIILVLVFH